MDSVHLAFRKATTGSGLALLNVHTKEKEMNGITRNNEGLH